MFKYSTATNSNLSNNIKHQFAMRHSLMIYQSNALYTFIPKNGCSTIRLSIALANGCIKDTSQANWIHSNNSTFNPSLAEAVRASYKFIVLRCPFRRLASVYLDKIVSKELDAWQLRDSQGRSFDLDNFTFRDFVNTLRKTGVDNCNIHWRKQNWFLLFDKYDDYFHLENMNDCAYKLQELIGLELVDARNITQHGTDRFEKINNIFFGDTPAFDIAAMKRNGAIPDHANLFDDDITKIVRTLYAEDIELYKNKTGERTLFL